MSEQSHTPTCIFCGGLGYKEVHQPGYTHYETDAGEGCPSYHYKRIPCPCEELKRLRAELDTLREHCACLDMELVSAKTALRGFSSIEKATEQLKEEVLHERELRDELLATLERITVITECYCELIPEANRTCYRCQSLEVIAKANAAKTGAAQESCGERPISADAQTDAREEQ